jgi:hypothetical protein
MDIWDIIGSRFSKAEPWGDPDKVCGALLLVLFQVRELTGHAVVIHNAWATSGHADNSYHYKGLAADFHLDNLPFRDAVPLLLAALGQLQLENFVGLGIYPDWCNPGFHLDLRGFRARWRATNVVDPKTGIVTQTYGTFEHALTEVK